MLRKLGEMKDRLFQARALTIPKASVLEARVGENMTPEQTATAYQTIGKPVGNYSANQAPDTRLTETLPPTEQKQAFQQSAQIAQGEQEMYKPAQVEVPVIGRVPLASDKEAQTIMERNPGTPEGLAYQQASTQGAITNLAGSLTGEAPGTANKLASSAKSLLEEAKKYKSADEFVKAQQELHHGTPYKFDELKPRTTFFSSSKDFAEKYGSTKSFDNEMDANITVHTRYGKLNFFDPNNSEHLAKLKENLPNELQTTGTWGGSKVAKDELLLRMQGKITVDPNPKYAEVKVGETFFDNHTGNDYTVLKVKPKSIVVEDTRSYLPKEIRIKELSKEKTIKEVDPWTAFEGDKRIENALKSLGYDGYKMTEGGEPTFAVFDNSKLKTKSQLTDIWKQAQENNVSGVKTLYHGSDNGLLKVDDAGNINFGTSKEDIKRFGTPKEIGTSNLTIKEYPTKEEMFDVANNKAKKRALIKKGIDVVISDNHALGINPESIAEKTGLQLREKSIKQKTLGELQATTWSELQKQNPDLFNNGILRKSFKPYDAVGEIPKDVHSIQGAWQNYGQYDEIPADKVYKRVDRGAFKGEYVDEQGFPVMDSNGEILKDVYNESTQSFDVPTVSNRHLRDALLESFKTKEGKAYLNNVVDALPKDKDGFVTAYRVGSIGKDGAQSYTLSEGMAKTFSNQGTDVLPAGTPGLPSKGYEDFGGLPVNAVKIDPKGIVAWSPYDAEILVEPKFVKRLNKKNTQ